MREPLERRWARSTPTSGPRLTLRAPCSTRLDEVIQLWDFLLAYGVHLNILCVIAQVLKMKEEIMESPSCVRPSSRA